MVPGRRRNNCGQTFVLPLSSNSDYSALTTVGLRFAGWGMRLGEKHTGGDCVFLDTFGIMHERFLVSYCIFVKCMYENLLLINSY
jgi:hypothetical protein